MGRCCFLSLLIAAISHGNSVSAAEGGYPERPVRVIVTFPAGGGTDIVARLVFQAVAERTGGTFIIDNRGGAGGTIGTELAAKAPADGYTIVVVSGSHTINPSLYKKLSYDAVRDFAPVTMLVTGPGLLVVHPSLPAQTVRQLISLAKARPGQIFYASAGNGTPPHLAAELFKHMAGVSIVHVPYKGNAQAMTDLIAGQVSLSFPTFPSALPHVQAGKLRALGVTSAKRSSALPDIPALAEAGVPGYEGSAWYGVLAPAGTPQGIVGKLHGELQRAIQAPELRGKLLAQGLADCQHAGGVCVRHRCRDRQMEQGRHCIRSKSGLVAMLTPMIDKWTTRFRIP